MQPKCNKYGQRYSQTGQIVTKHMTVLIQCLTYSSITEKVQKAQEYPNRQECRAVPWLRATDAFHPKTAAHFLTDTKYQFNHLSEIRSPPSRPDTVKGFPSLPRHNTHSRSDRSQPFGQSRAGCGRRQAPWAAGHTYQCCNQALFYLFLYERNHWHMGLLFITFTIHLLSDLQCTPPNPALPTSRICSCGSAWFWNNPLRYRKRKLLALSFC